MRSLKGKLLLDGGKLVDTVFHRSVVLICEHNADGAFGLVLNRLSEHEVGKALDVLLPDVVKHLPVFLGGPVQPQALSCLIHDPTDNDFTKSSVIRGLRLTHDLDDLVEAGEDFLTRVRFKFFAGYAGWSPGQLDNEMKQNAWLTHPASIEFVFHPQPQELWKTILLTKGPEYRLLAETPEDVSKN
jgi:putative transcriptional regulator